MVTVLYTVTKVSSGFILLFLLILSIEKIFNIKVTRPKVILLTNIIMHKINPIYHVLLKFKHFFSFKDLKTKDHPDLNLQATCFYQYANRSLPMGNSLIKNNTDKTYPYIDRMLTHNSCYAKYLV